MGPRKKVSKKTAAAITKKSSAVLSTDSNLEAQSLDDFVNNLDGSSSEDEEIIAEESTKPPKASTQPDDVKGTGAKSQKKYITSLKQKDPEFYEFLKAEDQELLNFDESSDEDDKSDEDKESGDEEDAVHQPPDQLEVASDESDFEDDDAMRASMKTGKVTRGQVDEWTNALNNSPNQKIIQTVVEAFKAAVSVVGVGEEEDRSRFRVEGGTIFNSVVRLCVVNLQPALKKFLKQGDDANFKPEKCKNWKMVEKHVRIYLSLLCSLLSRVTEPNVATVILKHLHQMIPFFQAYPKGEKQLLNKMILCWGKGEETVRILSLMCIVRLVRGSSTLLETAIKQMYMVYVKNCKFTSPHTLPQINFMRRSLIEVLGMDHNLAYYQAFIQIRQLAIHLRNAIVNQKKDALQAVYNWQFIHSLELWGGLLSHCAGSEVLQPLIFPIVQVCLGTVRLVPTSKYFPLRFHVATVLAELSAATNTFIPILPIYLDVLNTFNFDKKSKKVSMKPLDFTTVLKMSKVQLTENGFKDATIEGVYGGLVAYLANNSYRIGFPELVTPLIFQLKAFLKKCKVGNYCKKVKQVLDKVVANQKFIETRRKTVSFGVGDRQKIDIWEAQVERDGTPLIAFYKSWKKVEDSVRMKRVTEQQKLDDYAQIPMLKKNSKKRRMKMDTEPEVEGFLSGSDDEIDDEERFKLKEERGKPEPGKKRKKRDEPESEEEDSEEDVEAADDEGLSGDNGEAEDEVDDLRLEDMEDSDDSELELKDDFGDGSDDDDDDD